jgi:O-antigen/teichoic acid export membrane protein
LSVITIDQAIAGASNVLIAVLAARLLSVASFGLFGIVFLVYVMVQGVSRALVCDPLLVHPIEARERTAEPIGTSCLLGLGLGAVVLVGGLGARMWEPSLGDALIVLAVCVPLLVLQDLGRYIGIATHRPSAALVLDTVWLVLLFAAVAALLATHTRTLVWFIVAWAGTGALTGLLLFWQHRGLSIRPGLAWLRYTWTFSWRYLISYTSTQGAALTASSAVGGIAGPTALGGLQGATLLVRPFATFQVAAVAAGVSEISHSATDHEEVRRRGAKTSGLTTAIALVNVIVLLALPDRVGRVVLGATWHAAQPLLLPTGAQILCLGLITGARAGLLGMRAIRRAVVIDVVTTALVLAATVCGAVIDGVSGALWAVALVQGLMVIVWWMVLWTDTGRPRAGGRHRAEAMSRMPPVTVPTAALPTAGVEVESQVLGPGSA